MSDEDVVVRPWDEIIAELESRSTLSRGDIDTLMALLTLPPRGTFLKPGPPFRDSDVYPWHFNRRLSYLRKPLLVRETGNRRELVWGPRNLFLAGHQLFSICVSGRLEATSKEMKDLAGMFQREETRAFTEQIAACCRQAGAVVDMEVTKIGARRIERAPGQSAGDVDVLAIFPGQQAVLVVEAKSLETARTPAEIANELGLLVRGTKTKRATVVKHKERVQWIRDHLPVVLDRYGIAENRNKKWTVQGCVVVDREVLSGKLNSSDMPIMSYREFVAMQPWKRK